MSKTSFCLFFLITVALTGAQLTQFSCPYAGRFDNPDPTKCDTYIICGLDQAGTLIPMEVFCQGDRSSGDYCYTDPSSCNTEPDATYNVAALTCDSGVYALPGYNNIIYDCYPDYDSANHVILIFCPTGWIWNGGLTQCKVDPNNNNNPSLDPDQVVLSDSSAGGVCNNGPGLYANPDPTQCNTYISCGLFSATVFKCAANLVWRQSEQTCDYATPSDCLPSSSICIPGQGPVFPNPDDCTTYYICSNGIPYMMPCASGLIFDTVNYFCGYQAICTSNGFCATNPNSYYILSDTAYDVTCTTSMLNQVIPNYFDSTWHSFAVCTVQGPRLAYCCGNKTYNQNGYCE